VIRVFAGFDPREEVGYHAFCSSLLHHSSAFVSVTPLYMHGFPEGTNAFTFTRFLVPYLCGFKGWAVFVDGCDMVVNSDFGRIAKAFDPTKAVQVVKHRYKTKHPLKYRGTDMECPNRDYERKNWASMMLINCEHPAWAGMVPSVVEGMAEKPLSLLQLSWINDQDIGELPAEWNWLVDEFGENLNATILHWTAGIPGFPHYADAEMAGKWHRARSEVTACSA
jgi:hypothetical protein